MSRLNRLVILTCSLFSNEISVQFSILSGSTLDTTNSAHQAKIFRWEDSPKGSMGLTSKLECCCDGDILFFSEPSKECKNVYHTSGITIWSTSMLSIRGVPGPFERLFRATLVINCGCDEDCIWLLISLPPKKPQSRCAAKTRQQGGYL